MPLTNDDLAMLLSALAQTPQFQFLDQLMAQQGGADPGAEVPAAEAPPEAGAEDDLSDVQDLLVDEGSDDAAPDPAGEAPPAEEPPAEEEPAEKNGMLGGAASGGTGGAMAGGVGGAMIGGVKGAIAGMPGGPAGMALGGAGGAMLGGASGAAVGGLGGAAIGGAAGAVRRSNVASGQQPARYQQLRSAHNKLVQEHGRLASRMQGLIREKTDAQRSAALHGLARKYPDFVDVAAEQNAVLYSKQSTMDDATFATHCATIEKYALKASQVARSQRADIPMGGVDRPVRDADAEKYQMRLSNEAVQIYTQALSTGKQLTYDEAKQAAAARLGTP